MSSQLLLLLGEAEISSPSPPDSLGVSRSPSVSPPEGGKRKHSNLIVRCQNELMHLDYHQIEETLGYIEKSAIGRWMAHGGTTGDSLASLLREKERDLELAAKIGQSLLEQNRELQNRNEFLEEHLNGTNDTVVQLRHELQKRVDLLRMYSHLDEDALGVNGSEESLRNKVERLSSENDKLKNEHLTLRRAAEQYADRERQAVAELGRQVEGANDKVIRLQLQIAEKNEECVAHAHAVERLLKDIAMKGNREKQLAEENSDLSSQLEAAVHRQETLSGELKEMTEMYCEVKGMFHDAEEELRQWRQKPSPYRSPSIDSLYDSLASELENSDSGFSSTPFASARSEGASLRLELEKMGHTGKAIKENDEVDVPSAVLADIARKKISICDSAPAPPPQTPQSEQTTPIRAVHSEATPTDEGVRRDGEKEEVFNIGLPLAESTPYSREVQQGRRPSMQTATLSREVATACIETQTDPAPSVVDSAPKEATPTSEIKSIASTCCNCESSKPAPPQTLKLREFLGFPGTSHQETMMAPVSKSSSTDSLSDYVEPKMGEPGVPGTRDLDYSIRQVKIRKQVEKDYARFRQRKGLPPAGAPLLNADEKPKKCVAAPSFSNNESWQNYSIVMGQEHQRSIQPWRAVQHIGLGVIRGPMGTGVLTRAELPSPQSSPIRVGGASSPSFSRGLAGVLPSFGMSHAPSAGSPTDFINTGAGILSRRGL